MTDPNAFAKLVPGFDFMQDLVKNAGAAIPGIGHWVAPTLDPDELDKRITELRTVQFWLEQNARMLATTIQAMEVQKMTLTTLKTMNVSLGDLTESLKIRMPEPATAPPPAAAPAPAPATEAAPIADEAPAAPPGVIDPMQWWGALTKQFTEIAANALKEVPAAAAGAAGTPAVKAAAGAARKTPRKTARKTAAKAPAKKRSAPRRPAGG